MKHCVKLPENLYIWQQNVVNDISEYKDNNRLIHWYIIKESNIGLTTLIKYLIIKNNANYIENGTSKYIFKGLFENPKIVILDLTKIKKDKINYYMIESIKDGIFDKSITKNESKIIDSPHLIIFSKYLPEYHTMSLDRWRVIEINK